LWSLYAQTTSTRAFPKWCTKGSITPKFLLDNKRLTAKMWEKVVESGKTDRVRGIQELKSRSRWKSDPALRQTARKIRV